MFTIRQDRIRVRGMAKMINDSDFLYRTLMKNIYWQGKVIGHKFSLLRIAYNIFMYGIAISVVAYTITAIYYSFIVTS